MLTLNFTELYTDPHGIPTEDLRDLIGQASNLFARFSVQICGETVYEDDSFPVVEFAHQLKTWLADPPGNRPSLIYDSMFFEDPGELSFVRENNLWILRTPEQEEALGRVSGHEIQRAVTGFVDNLREACSTKYDVELLI